MSCVEVFDLPFCEETKLSLLLFTNVENMKTVKEHAMKGKLNVALIKTSMVVDVFHVLSAASKALHGNLAGKMTTKNIHSEVLFSLSPTKNISDSFKKFGIDNNERSLLVAEIHKRDQSQISDICTLIHGNVVPMSKISDFTDTQLIHKVYKIKEAEVAIGSLSQAVVGRMASKEFVSL